MVKILGLTGPIGCGKSTVARDLTLLAASRNWQFMTISFARPLKMMMVSLLENAGYDHYEAMHLCFDQAGKAKPLECLQGRTTRQAQQWLGTEWGRNLMGQNLWTDIAMSLIEKNPRCDFFVIDDVRFPSEQARIEEMGGIVIRLDRTGVEYDLSHESEQVLNCRVVKNETDPYKVAQKIMKIVLDNHA